jgi:hypothetical protein
VEVRAVTGPVRPEYVMTQLRMSPSSLIAAVPLPLLLFGGTWVAR